MGPASLLIAPSLLAADFGGLREQVQALQAAGADWLHLDVMDGRFVPNITMGSAVVGAIRKASLLPLDVHLMIVEPEKHIEAFAKEGADHLVIHAEATACLRGSLEQIRALGKRAGVALNPSTSEGVVHDVLDLVDLLVVMSVHPGFSGQSFLPVVLPKLERVAALVRARHLEITVGIDGGINERTIIDAVQAGAQSIVVGSAILQSGDYGRAIACLRTAAQKALSCPSRPPFALALQAGQGKGARASGGNRSDV